MNRCGVGVGQRDPFLQNSRKRSSSQELRAAAAATGAAATRTTTPTAAGSEQTEAAIGQIHFSMQNSRDSIEKHDLQVKHHKHTNSKIFLPAGL